MPQFNGTLNSNAIYASLFNMIISQEVFADTIANGYDELVNRARVDGSLYGDTKLYYSADVLKSTQWGADAEATNLLQINRAKAPECQKITLNKFRQISLTNDMYLSKQAWADEYAFSQFNSVMLNWIRETKKVYDITTYNAFVGTAVSPDLHQNINIDTTSAVGTATGESAARIKAGVIGAAVAKLLAGLKDVSRDFNDYGHMRSYSINDLLFIWNTDKIAEIEARDLPTIYHKDIIEKLGEYRLPGRYFGTVNASATAGKADGTIKSLIEQDIKATSGSTVVHLFAGEAVPEGFTAPAGTSYTVDSSILFKVIHKRSIPYMSAFEVGTTFFNPKSLTENHYLTWGHNTLEYLKNFPMITVKEV